MNQHPYFEEDKGAQAGNNGNTNASVTAEEVAKLQAQVKNLNAAVHERTTKIDEYRTAFDKNQQAFAQANQIIAAYEVVKSAPTVAGLAQWLGKNEDELIKSLGLPKGTDPDMPLGEDDVSSKIMKQVDSRFAALQNEVKAAKDELTKQRTEFDQREQARQTREFTDSVNKLRETHFSEIEDEDWEMLYPGLLLKISRAGMNDGPKAVRDWVNKFSSKSHERVTKLEKEVAEKTRQQIISGGLPVATIPEGGYKTYDDAEAAFDKTTEALRGYY